MPGCGQDLPLAVVPHFHQVLFRGRGIYHLFVEKQAGVYFRAKESSE